MDEKVRMITEVSARSLIDALGADDLTLCATSQASPIRRTPLVS